ncbi:hypothetical protein KKB55_13270, partial [Myxococcota bacterium]|nr:hypothetical protein [Myxococcota bacterium]
LEGARWRATRRAEAAAYALEREAEGALIEAELWALEQRAMGAVLRGAGASRYLALEAAARLEAAGMGGTATGPLSLDEWRRRLGRPPRPSAD